MKKALIFAFLVCSVLVYGEVLTFKDYVASDGYTYDAECDFADHYNKGTAILTSAKGDSVFIRAYMGVRATINWTPQTRSCWVRRIASGACCGPNLEVIEFDDKFDVDYAGVVIDKGAISAKNLKRIILNSEADSYILESDAFVGLKNPLEIEFIYPKEYEEEYRNHPVWKQFFPIDVEGITLESDKLKIMHGKSAGFSYTVFPENASYKDVIWESEDPDIATVSADGEIYGVKPGMTTIKVRSARYESVESKCSIEVLVQEVESLELDKERLTVELDSSEPLNYTLLPENATDKAVHWTSTNPAVAYVANNVVYGMGVGKAVVTVSSWDYRIQEACYVEVVEPQSGMEEVGRNGAAAYVDARAGVLRIAPDVYAVRAEMYDEAGKCVLSMENPASEIALNAFKAGVYVLRLHTQEGKTLSQKVIL